jgi:carboxynorspermidine decarboxylase
MMRRQLDIDVRDLETPAYVVDLGALRENLEILADVQARAECTILLALKGFAMWNVFPLVREYLPGIAASSPDEARLGREEHGGEVHAYAPAYSPADLEEILRYADHVIFNSPSQWRRLRPQIEASTRSVACGLRINPEHSEVKVPIYDPCAPGSRLGIRRADLRDEDLEGITGLHFHSLCELGADSLERTLAAVEARFGPLLPRMQWVNFGGGHHITRPDYDRELLVRLVREFCQRYGVRVILEPGEAIALDTGVLVASVLDLIESGDTAIAILDTSATAHMPDVLEMPYRPGIVGAGAPGEHPYTYRLGGLTCLAGDVIGDYAFPRPLEIGDKLVFTDMAHYTMVKNTTFNGVRLPSIATHEPRTGTIEVVRRFGYDDYRGRLS